RDRPDRGLSGALRRSPARGRREARASPHRRHGLSLRLLPRLQLLLHRALRAVAAAQARGEPGVLRRLLPVPGLPGLPVEAGLVFMGGYVRPLHRDRGPGLPAGELPALLPHLSASDLGAGRSLHAVARSVALDARRALSPTAGGAALDRGDLLRAR